VTLERIHCAVTVNRWTLDENRDKDKGGGWRGGGG
jgi:hypothetical protein